MIESRTFEIGVASSTQSAHPEIAEDLLRTGMGQKSAVVASESQSQTRLTTPVGQFAGEQLLGQHVVLPVAVIEHFQRFQFELFGVAAQFDEDVAVQVVLGRLRRQRSVQFAAPIKSHTIYHHYHHYYHY